MWNEFIEFVEFVEFVEKFRRNPGSENHPGLRPRLV
jgi:hypothetical protein